MPDEPIDVQKWFIDQPPSPEHTYELALVLGGRFSEGQVADFLLRKMDDALAEWDLNR